MWDHKPGDWQVQLFLSSGTNIKPKSHEYTTSNSSVIVSLNMIWFVIFLKPLSRSGTELQTKEQLKYKMQQ